MSQNETRHLPLRPERFTLWDTCLLSSAFVPVLLYVIALSGRDAFRQATVNAIGYGTVGLALVWMMALFVRSRYSRARGAPYHSFVMQGERTVPAVPGKLYRTSRLLTVLPDMGFRLGAVKRGHPSGTAWMVLTVTFRNEEPTAEDARTLNRFYGRLVELNKDARARREFLAQIGHDDYALPFTFSTRFDDQPDSHV